MLEEVEEAEEEVVVELEAVLMLVQWELEESQTLSKH